MQERLPVTTNPGRADDSLLYCGRGRDVMVRSLTKQTALLSALAIAISTAILLLVLVILFGLIPGVPEAMTIPVGITLPTLLALYAGSKAWARLLGFQTEAGVKKTTWIAVALMMAFIIIYIGLYGSQFESTAVLVAFIVHFLVVSLGEEYTYRCLIPGLMKGRFSDLFITVTSAFLFAFVLHNNEDLVINGLVRFPLGIFFAWLAKRTGGIAFPVVFHTIYNLMVII